MSVIAQYGIFVAPQYVSPFLAAMGTDSVSIDDNARVHKTHIVGHNLNLKYCFI